jgi:hypothetical protein
MIEPRWITVPIEIVVIFILILMLSQFRKSKELIKARLFLRYDTTQRMMVGVGIIAMLIIASHSLFLLTGGDPAFTSWENFFPSGVYVLIINFGIIYVGLTIYFMLRGIE